MNLNSIVDYQQHTAMAVRDQIENQSFVVKILKNYVLVCLIIEENSRIIHSQIRANIILVSS